MDTPAKAIAQPWERAAQHLSGVLECRRGICAWERATDGRWYLIQVVPTLFPDEEVIEMRWGGRQRPPLTHLAPPSGEDIGYRGLVPGYLPTQRPAWVLSRPPLRDAEYNDRSTFFGYGNDKQIINDRDTEKLVKPSQSTNLLVQGLRKMVNATHPLLGELAIKILQLAILIEKPLNRINSITCPGANTE